ncbi:MAG TPA: hypothetical protein PLC59_07995 [Bacteroidales bacterium]|jgi:hypothetical protein|nr:hypothetical protein [Bacteroidales bacterium]HQI45983.1 hypothetical protein [Bacteroidales bacterium]
MGWTFCNKGLLTTKEFFKREFNFTKPEEGRSGTVLECATKNNVAYIAYQSVTPEKTEVIALVCLLRHSPKDPDGLTFGYKDISEDMGPTASECPAKILKLLTKTTNQLSLEWRARCWENIEKKKKNPKVNPEDWIQFSSPITFRSGKSYDVFKWMRGNYFTRGCNLFRIPRWRSMEYTNLGPISPLNALI